MSFQTYFMGKCSAALRAHKGFFSSVLKDVRLEGALPRECGGAVRASKGLVARVRQHVCLPVAFLIKYGATLGTRKGFLASVDERMYFQLVFPSESRIALIACKYFFYVATRVPTGPIFTGSFLFFLLVLWLIRSLDGNYYKSIFLSLLLNWLGICKTYHYYQNWTMFTSTAELVKI